MPQMTGPPMLGMTLRARGQRGAAAVTRGVAAGERPRGGADAHREPGDGSDPTSTGTPTGTPTGTGDRPGPSRIRRTGGSDAVSEGPLVGEALEGPGEPHIWPRRASKGPVDRFMATMARMSRSSIAARRMLRHGNSSKKVRSRGGSRGRSKDMAMFYSMGRRWAISMRLRRRKGPRKAPCETPAALLDGVAGPAKLDLPVLGLATRSSEMKTCFKRQYSD